MAGTLGIIAGGGELPLAIAREAQNAGRTVFVLALTGMALGEDMTGLPHEFVGIGEIGKAIKLLKEKNCEEVTFAGRVMRPNFSGLKLDTRGMMALPRVVAAARHGDDALLRAVLSLFEQEGFKIVGTDGAAEGLLAVAGAYGKTAPDEDALTDIALARKVVAAMGALDIGQGAVVAHGLVLAVEAAEGTDEMLKRVALLSPDLRGTVQARRGVLVKAPKPNQERRVDLPVIGAGTVTRAAHAGLSGIAVQAGGALIVDKARVVEEADRLGLFLFGFSA